MSISRGEFLRTFGKSLPGMLFNAGLVGAAGKVLNKMAAASAVGAPQEALTPGTSPAAAPKFQHIDRGPEGRNEIAFTFDDGPIPGVLERFLDEFKVREVHATFFLIGSKVEQFPELARRIHAEGHEIANHTFTHPKLPALSPIKAEEEIARTQDILNEIVGLRPTFFRPPYGEFRDDQAPLLHRHGLRSVMGDVDPQDWSQPGEHRIASCILDKTCAGSILICHEFSEQTANIIGDMLDQLMARGLTPVTLSKLLV